MGDRDEIGNDEDTEKGEIQPPDAEASKEKAGAAKAKADEADEADDAQADARAIADDDDDKADAKQADDEKAESKSNAKDDVDGDEDEAEPESAEPKPKTEDTKSRPEKKGAGSYWWVALLVVLVTEFYVYGRRGDIEVCVGKQDVHDFSLLGTERTDDTRWKFPRCEARVNLGLRSQYDELTEDATNVACRGATLFRQRGEAPQCTAGSDGWTKQVQTSYIWPWDSRYYEHLLWFLFE